MILLSKDNKKLRLIALASSIFKIAKSMILYRLYHYVENKCLLPEVQNSFRKERSCMHSLTALIADIHNSFTQKQLTAAVLLDIKSAFDMIIPSKLQGLLIDCKIPYNIRLFIDHMIKNKGLYFKVQNEIKGPFSRNWSTWLPTRM